MGASGAGKVSFHCVRGVVLKFLRWWVGSWCWKLAMTEGLAADADADADVNGKLRARRTEAAVCCFVRIACVEGVLVQKLMECEL